MWSHKRWSFGPCWWWCKECSYFWILSKYILSQSSSWGEEKRLEISWQIAEVLRRENTPIISSWLGSKQFASLFSKSLLVVFPKMLCYRDPKTEQVEWKWMFPSFTFRCRMWTSVVPITSEEKVPCTRSKHASVLHGQSLFLLGGRNGNVPLKDFWRYHIGKKCMRLMCD